MIILKSDNRILTEDGAVYSYLVDNCVSNSSSITIVNTENFEVDDFILIEDFGKETAEIFRVGAVNATTGVISLFDSTGNPSSTKFSHTESTKIYVLPYNQIRFFWTTSAGDITDEAPPFNEDNPLTSWLDLDPASWYTQFSDPTNSTGFGWFVYRNSVSTFVSQESNPIPYGGFAGNTVEQVFFDFDSLLNTNELSLVSMAEKFSWLNEALAFLKNKLNLNNIEYFVSVDQTLSVVAGTKEYILPSDFSDLVYIIDDSGLPVPFMNVKDTGSYTGSILHYYMRNRYIGFSPTPSSSATFTYKYRSKAVVITSVSTYLDLPDNAFYALKDFMLYRAMLKFKNPMSDTYYQSFTNSVNHFVQASIKRDADLDSWSIASYANN